MNETKNGAPVADAVIGDRARWRQYRITARLLREYTARLYRIADDVGAYLDWVRGGEKYVGVTETVVTAVARYRVLWEEVSDAALYASGMLVHFGLDEAEAAELRIRLRDAEHAVARAGGLVHDAILSLPPTFGSPISGERMKGIIRHSRELFPQ